MAMRGGSSSEDSESPATLAAAATDRSASGGRVAEAAEADDAVADPEPPAAPPGPAETPAAEDSPQPVEPEPVAVEPPEPTATVAAKAPRKRGVACFYKEDKRSFIRQGRKKASTIEHQGTCYTCREAGAHVVTTLSPPLGKTCRTSHLCRATQTDECSR